MNTTSRRDDVQSLPEPAERRRPRDVTALVVAVYAVLSLAAPLIVRYAPGPSVVAFATPAWAADATLPPCVPASEGTCPPVVDDLD